MAAPRLPGVEALGPLPSGRSGRAIAQFDTSAIGEGVADAGHGMQVAGRVISLENRARRDELEAESNQREEYEARIREQQFQANEEGLLNKAFVSSQPGAEGFGKTYFEGANQRAVSFVNSLPPRLRLEFTPRVQEFARGVSGRVNAFEAGERERFWKGQTDSALNNIGARIYSSPDQYDSLVAEGNRLIDLQPGVSPITRDEQRSAWSRGSQVALGHWAQDNISDPDVARATLGLPTSPDAQINFLFDRLVTAVEGQESGGDPNAVSPAGALGVMQVMPDTAREIATEIGDANFPTTGDADIGRYLSNRAVGKAYGRYYLGKQLRAYNGDLEAALIAYNGGPVRADKFLESGRDWSVLPEETREYVPAVIARLGLTGAQPTELGPAVMLSPETFSSRHYSWSDFRNDRFADARMDSRVVTALDNVTDQFGRGKLTLTSGYRSPEYNASASFTGKEGPHTHGSAVAIDVSGYSDEEKAQLIALFVANGATGLGHYSNGSIHVDFRDKPGRGPGGLALWYNRNQAYTDGPAWFASGVQTGLAQRGSAVATGQAPPMDARFAGMPLDDRLQIVSAIEKRRNETDALEKFDVSQLVSDDVQSMESSGRGVDGLTSERVLAALGEEKFLDWQQDRSLAQAKFRAVDGLDAMTPEQIEQRVASLAPQPGAPGYDNAQTVYETAETRAEKIQRERTEDPARSVMTLPEVRQAGNAFDPDDSASSWQRLIGARIAAQGRVGIPSALQLPITKDEARLFAAPIRTATETEWFDRFDEMSAGVRREFGPCADEVIRQIVTEFVRDPDKAMYASNIIQSLLAGEAPDATAVTAVDELTETARVEATARQLSGSPPNARRPRTGPSAPVGSRVTPPASPQAVEAVLSQLNAGVRTPGRPEPSAEAIKYLRANPGTIGQFMEIYGNAPIPLSQGDIDRPPGITRSAPANRRLRTAPVTELPASEVSPKVMQERVEEVIGRGAAGRPMTRPTVPADTGLRQAPPAPRRAQPPPTPPRSDTSALQLEGRPLSSSLMERITKPVAEMKQSEMQNSLTILREELSTIATQGARVWSRADRERIRDAIQSRISELEEALGEGD